jgi:hypothetical protein
MPEAIGAGQGHDPSDHRRSGRFKQVINAEPA